MDLLMCFKVARSREELLAVRARVRFLPCVDPLMFFKVVCIRERLVTETKYSFFHPIRVAFNSIARARFLPCVDHIMSFEVARLREELVTVRTIVRFITCVDNFMLFKVTRQQE